jgi:hypothetical protein
VLLVPPLPARRRLSSTPIITGDSLKLSRLAGQTNAEYIVFCGVHFMAEVADILSKSRTDLDPARPRRRLFDGRHGQPGQGRARLARTCRRTESGREGDAGHLHQFRRRPQGLLRRTRRHRLHLVQRAEDPRLGLRPARESAVLPRPAPRPLERIQDGHPARGNGDLESRPRTRRPHARADRQGEDHPLARLLFRAPDVPAEATSSSSATSTPTAWSSRTRNAVSKSASSRTTSAAPRPSCKR